MFDEDYKSPERQLTDRNDKSDWANIHPRKPIKLEKIPKLNTPNGMRSMPKTMEEIYILSDELIEWADKEDSILLQQFALSKKISPYNFYDFAKKSKNEYFKQAFEYARAQCSIKMVMHGSKLKDIAVNRYMPIYDIFYNQYITDKENRDHEFTKELKALDAKNSGNEKVDFNIHMLPSSSNMKPCTIIDIEKK